MSAVTDLERRGSYTPRRVREQRAYRLAVTGGIAAAVGVVALVLAIAGVGGGGIAIVALIIAAVCGFLFRRSVSR